MEAQIKRLDAEIKNLRDEIENQRKAMAGMQLDIALSRSQSDEIYTMTNELVHQVNAFLNRWSH